MVVANALTTFFSGTGCTASEDWANCEFYGRAAPNLSISSAYPFPITADLSVNGGYSDSFVISCTDNEGTYIALPSSFTENCVTSPKTAPVIADHPYDPVHYEKPLVNNTLTSFFAGSDCVADADWKTCVFTEEQKQLSIDTSYPFQI